jgi:diguanylate cyclase (GGDEF)-like protein
MSMTEVACPTCGGSGSIADPVSEGTDDGTLRDRNQTSSDQDQTWSDHDQTASERDQRSADEDQTASDDDFAAGSDPVIHERTTAARERTSRDREAVSHLRDETSAERVETADDRDRSAELRDRGAENRDRLARLHDVQDDTDAGKEDILLRAERDRARAATDRAKAADDRTRAAADRAEAVTQRAEAQHARAEARHNLELASTDDLTGARSRKFGLVELGREIERSRRTGETLTLAFIDVDGLKGVNDTYGHPAGDRLLHLVAETVRANVRPYDVIVRYGGDEFLCAMPNLNRAGAKRRMNTISAVLRAVNDAHSITFGLAECEPADGIKEFIGRADEDLLNARRSRDVPE